MKIVWKDENGWMEERGVDKLHASTSEEDGSVTLSWQLFNGGNSSAMLPKDVPVVVMPS